MRKLLYRIFFTKSDEIDLSQFYLLLLNITFVVWVVMVGLRQWIVSEPMLNAFLMVYGTTVILSSPSWLVRLWIESKWFKQPSSTSSLSSQDVPVDDH